MVSPTSAARARAGRSILPGGAVLWAWDADPDFDEQAGEQWLILLPKKWNPKTHTQVYSWRYDPRELGAAQGSTPDARRPHARTPGACDDGPGENM